ncbi:hypothetical protein BC628DRAFT_1396292 [Trametes gibbosa]|nr:hypothetical protein BC628DRAFT_1396292 [Trametes gibbosa]
MICILRHLSASIRPEYIPATNTGFQKSRNSNMATHSSSLDLGRLHWPAPASQMSAARDFLHDCATANTQTLLLPDKDADGLCSSIIVYYTLLHLGLSPAHISVHFPSKGSNIHTPVSRAAIMAFGARFVIATDQGSRAGPPIAPEPARTLVVDHHFSNEFPSGAVACSAAHSEPVATSATLAYELCRPLLGRFAVDGLRERLEWLCVMGTMGDLGTGFKWEPPFPDMHACLKKWTKKVLGEAVGLVNAPRRTASYDVPSAWRALLHSTSPRDLIDSASSNKDVKHLFAARAEVKLETTRCARSPPVFSGDGRVALVRISSPAQVHPLIATRWASSLKGARLEVVMCANDGYTPGLTNFACRIARAGVGFAKVEMKRGAGEATRGSEDAHGGTDIIALLEDYAGRVPGLRESMGDDFARGHKQASGGIVRSEDFERLWDVMVCAGREDGAAPTKKRKLAGSCATQQNTLDGWLKKT